MIVCTADCDNTDTPSITKASRSLRSSFVYVSMDSTGIEYMTYPFSSDVIKATVGTAPRAPLLADIDSVYTEPFTSDEEDEIVASRIAGRSKPTRPSLKLSQR